MTGGAGAGAVLGPVAAILAFARGHRVARVHARREAGGAVKAITIAATDLRRLLRWRANIFFLFVLPMLIILLLGAAFGGAPEGPDRHPRGPRGALAQQFVAALAGRPSTRRCHY